MVVKQLPPLLLHPQCFWLYRTIYALFTLMFYLHFDSAQYSVVTQSGLAYRTVIYVVYD